MQSYPGKRAVDLIAAGMACLIFAPLAAAIALLTWLEDRGSPLFLQTRVGYRRRPFTVFKFRTMRDQQVTRVGRWLRQTGLDELPQFINVCRGEMSVIGPRPLTSEDVRRLGWATQNHEWRFATRPGITGLSQLLAGRSARYSRRLERLYLRRQGFSFDLRLIALSFAVSLAGKRIVRQWLRRTTGGSTRQGTRALERSFDPTEMSMSALQTAMVSGAASAEILTAAYLARIARYDQHGSAHRSTLATGDFLTTTSPDFSPRTGDLATHSSLSCAAARTADKGD